MRCPFCNSEDTKVIDSRPAEEQNAIRRRRECVSCQKRFTTYERLETFPLMVIKKDQSREPYSREKAEAGIRLAKLYDLDAVAYVRFASVYREFKDVDTFAAEITKLLKGNH